MTADLPRRIGFWGAAAVMVGVVIGSGIFRTPAAIADEMGAPWLILALWLLGGLIALAGALTFAEIAAARPHSGGLYVFLRDAFGRPTAFVFGWTYMLLIKPFAAAGIAIIFAEHLNALLGVSWDARVVTTVALVVLTAIHTIGVGPGTAVAKALTAFKVVALAAIIVLGLALGNGAPEHFIAQPDPKPLLAALAPVMAAILWTYDGWSDVGAIAGEIENPQRTLPRVFLLGTAAVTALYVAVNAVYLWLLPLDAMRATDTVAPLIMDQLLGPAGATAVTLIVVLSTIGSTHSSIMTGARVTYAQARDGLLFPVLARVHPRFQTPAVALWVQLALSCAALWYAGSFQALAEGFVFTMWIFYGLAAVGIFIFRRREPHAARPYRCWGYPVVPALFILAAAGMTALTIYSDLTDPASRGRSTLPWIGVLVAGLPVYHAWNALTRRASHRPPPRA